MNCKQCGRPVKRLHGDMCQRCYNYFNKGNVVHPLPNPGEVGYTDEGKLVCHICGMAFERLGRHVHDTHDMTIEEYKKEFSLCSSKGLLSDKSRQKINNSLKPYKRNILDVLLGKGIGTRFKKGSAGRPKEKMNLQTLNIIKSNAKNRS